MSSTASVATATSTGPVQATAASQGGIFEGLNPSVWNPADPIILFIIQATLVIGLTRILYWPLAKIHEPRVIAEVITGILLGPSVMGRIPGFTAAIFPPASMPPFRLAANIGLILYLFLVGLEIDLGYLLRNWRIAISVASLDMAIPFGLGFALAYGLYQEFRNEPGIAPISFGVYGLFIAIAIAITAFPVLCRILTSLKLLNSAVGVIVLTSGIINDVVGWILLALCVTLVNSGAGITTLYIILVSIGYSLFLAYALRPAFMWVLRKTHSLDNGPTQGVVALTIFLVFASAFFTSIIGIHSIFGAFMVGLMCPHDGGFAIKLTEKLEDLIATLFVPLFFALSGINTNLGLLDSGRVWAYVFAVIFVAFFSKLIGGTAGARLNGLVWRESFTIGSLMSCKGLVELIVLNIGREARILSTRTFTMFVVMALVTTFATSPLVMWLYPPAYQQKLELWKQGKIDWSGNPIQSPDQTGDDDDDSSDRIKPDVATRLLVYIRTDGLSSILSTISLFTSTGRKATAEDTSTSSLDPDTQTTHLGGESMKSGANPVTAALKPGPVAAPQPLLRINGCRLVELSERNSSVMKVSEIEEYAGHDPIIKAFGTSANNTSRDVVVSGKIAVVPEDSFADTLATEAAKAKTDLVLVPWSETGSVSELPSFFSATPKGDPLDNNGFAGLMTKIFDSARHVSAVAVYLDRTLLDKASSNSDEAGGPRRAKLTRHISAGVSLAETQDPAAVKFFSAEGKTQKSIRVLFTGSEDDLYAVRLALQLAQAEGVALEVVEAFPASGAPAAADFGRVKAKIDASLADRVTFTKLDVPPAAVADGPDAAQQIAASLLSSAPHADANVSTVLILGRSSSATRPASSPAQGSSTAESSSTPVVESRNTLGPVAAAVAHEIKRAEAANVSILVVQAKRASPPPPAATEKGQELKRKPSVYSHASADHP